MKSNAKAAIAQADLGLAQANLSAATAQVDLAAATVEKTKALLAYTKVTAPFDGVETRRLVNRGDLVQAPTANRTTPLLKVQRIDTIRVFCDLPEAEAPRVLVARDGSPQGCAHPASAVSTHSNGALFTWSRTGEIERLSVQTGMWRPLSFITSLRACQTRICKISVECP